MPKKQHSELAAGIFVVTVLVVTLLVVLWLGAADIFQPAVQRAFFKVDQKRGTVGLEVGNPVLINDEPIGKIVEIRHDPKQCKTFYIAQISHKDREIYTDGKAHPDVPFIGGGRLVVTSRGSKSEGEPKDEESAIELGTGGLMGTLSAEMDRDNEKSLVGRLNATVADIQKSAEDVATITQTVRDEMDPKNDASALHLIKEGLENVNAVTASLRAETDPDRNGSVVSQVHKTLGRMDKAAADIEAMTADAKPKLQKIMTDVSETSGKIKDLTKSDVAEILATIRKASTPMLEAVKNLSDLSRQVAVVHRQNIDEILDNLAQVSVNLKSTSKEVRRNPWKLFYTPDAEEEHSSNIAEAARAFSSGASELDQAITKLNALAKAHPKGIPADDPQLKDIRKKIEESFAKFTRVEEALWEALLKKP